MVSDMEKKTGSLIIKLIKQSDLISLNMWHQAHGDSMAVSIASLDYQKVYQIISNTSICKVNGNILRYASNT